MMPTAEKDLLILAKAARKTNNIPTELLPFFNQDGRWIGAPCAWSKSTILSTACIMRGILLPSRQRTRRIGGRRILLTTLEIKEPTASRWHEIQGDVLIEDNVAWGDQLLELIQGSIIGGKKLSIRLPRLYTVVGDFRTHVLHNCRIDTPRLRQIGGSMHVRSKVPPSLESIGGSLYLRNIRAVSLQSLVSVGGSMEITGSRGVRAENLKIVGGDLCLGPRNLFLQVPKLREIGGSMLVAGAIIVIAPDLVRIGGDADTRRSRDFGSRKLRVGGNWQAHPTVTASMTACARACEIIGTTKDEITL